MKKNNGKKMSLKKMTALLLALCLSLCVGGALAAGEDTFTVSENQLTVRLPEGIEPVIGCFSGDCTLVTAGESVTADGRKEAVYVLPEEARGESHLFQIAADLSGGELTEVRSLLFSTLKGGDLYLMGHALRTPEFYVDICEGYEYSEGKTLLVQLPGGEYTGWIWTLIPDNSGVLDLVDCYEIDMREKEEDPLVTATGFFFLPAENPVGTTARLRFTLDEAPEGETAGAALTFEVTLDGEGQITEILRVE